MRLSLRKEKVIYCCADIYNDSHLSSVKHSVADTDIIVEATATVLAINLTVMLQNDPRHP